MSEKIHPVKPRKTVEVTLQMAVCFQDRAVHLPETSYKLILLILKYPS